VTRAVADAGRALRAGDDPRRLARRLLAAHDRFVSTGVPDPVVRPLVAESWQRALAGGLDPEHSRAPLDLVDDALEHRRTDHPLAPAMTVIRRLLGDDAADAGLLVAVSDADGRLLWVEGHSGLRGRAEDMHFVPGARWSEDAAGTNAPGTALALDRPVQIFGAEHLLRQVTAWSCTAAPIHDPLTGGVLGALDITGGNEVAAPHTLALVRATVAAVEAELRAPADRYAGPRLDVLGTAGAVLHLGGTRTRLGLRHAEILAILAAHPDGLDGPALSVALHEFDGPAVTLRAEISRLRVVLGGDLLKSRPYRLDATVRTDADVVRSLLVRGAVAEAVERYSAPLLPRSEAPAVVAMRLELHEQVRAAALRSADPSVLLTFGQRSHGRLDWDVWTAAGRALPPADPRRALVAGHLAWLDAELAG
jgi:hypothetical protein